MKDLIIAIVVFSGLIIGLASIYGEMATNYNISVENLSYMNQSQNISLKLNRSFNELVNTTPNAEQSPITSGINALTGWYKAVELGFMVLVSIPLLFVSMVSDMANVMALSGFPIPPFMLLIVGGVITIIIVFALIKFLRSGEVEG